MNKVAVFGDIHGDLRKLELALSDERISDRLLIFVGDYVDRGPDSEGVISRLIELESSRNCVFLKGNHESLLQNFLKDKNLINYAKFGGLETIKSYLKQEKANNVVDKFIESFPTKHLDFLKKLKIFWENDEIFVSHSGLNPSNVVDRSERYLVNNRESSIFENGIASFSKICIFGHYVQKNRQPYIRKNVRCIDTGCGSINGPLSVYLYPEDVVISF